MTSGDLAPVVATLVEAADPGKVTASALAAYALEASQADPRSEVALVASLAPTPIDTPEVVGVCGILLDDDLKPKEMRLRGTNAAYVTNLAVASRARNKGIASDLLSQAEQLAKKNGCKTVWCRVDGDNELARRMYSRRNYAPREPAKVITFRKTMATAYGFAGVAHFVDLVVGPSTLVMSAGAPDFYGMNVPQQILALVWCVLGPASFVANKVAEENGAPKIAVAGLVVYSVFETALACLCAFYYGAKGGDAATGAVAVQAVVFLCYKTLAPGNQGEKISLAKDIEMEDTFVSMWIGWRGVGGEGGVGSQLGVGAISHRTQAACKASDNNNENDVQWNTLSSGDPRVDDGWVGDVAEPLLGSVNSFGSRDEASEKEEYERDDSGRMVYAAHGFFYDGILPSDVELYGMTERVKVDVGIVGKKRQRVFALRKRLGTRNGVVGAESDIVEVTMERPLGIVVDRDLDGFMRVADFVEGSRAGRANAVAQLQGMNQVGAQTPKKGDVVRAFTTTTLSYGPRAQLLGDLSGTKRAVVLFGADDQPWGKTIGALKNGLVADGPVTLILERERDSGRANAWTPEPAPVEKPQRTKKNNFLGQKTTTGSRNADFDSAPRSETNSAGRQRVSNVTSNAVDPINAALAAAGVSFVLLIFTGFG